MLQVETIREGNVVTLAGISCELYSPIFLQVEAIEWPIKPELEFTKNDKKWRIPAFGKGIQENDPASSLTGKQYPTSRGEAGLNREAAQWSTHQRALKIRLAVEGNKSKAREGTGRSPRRERGRAGRSKRRERERNGRGAMRRKR